MKKQELTKKLYDYMFGSDDISLQEITKDIKDYETKQCNISHVSGSLLVDLRYLTEWITKCLDVIEEEEGDINLIKATNTFMVLLNVLEKAVEQ